jgi:hypothetical protein
VGRLAEELVDFGVSVAMIGAPNHGQQLVRELKHERGHEQLVLDHGDPIAIE